MENINIEVQNKTSNWQFFKYESKCFCLNVDGKYQYSRTPMKREVLSLKRDTVGSHKIVETFKIY